MGVTEKRTSDRDTRIEYIHREGSDITD